MNRKLLTFLSILSLASCDQQGPTAQTSEEASNTPRSLDELLSQVSNDANREDVVAGIQALKERRLKDASRSFNTALLDDPTNSYLHTLNGISYHLMAKEGNMEGYDLAEAGYMQAKKFDSSNAFAALQLGRIKVEKKDLVGAQEEFAQTLLLDPKNEQALYELTAVSYQMGDLKTARMGSKRLILAQPQNANYLRTAALVAAASDDTKGAQEYQAKYNALVARTKDREYLAQRLDDWHRSHAAGEFRLTQATGPAAGDPDTTPAGSPPPAGGPNFDAAAATPPAPSAGSDPAAGGAAPAAPMGPVAGAAPAGGMPPATTAGKKKGPYDDMMVIDVVVMRVSEEGRTQKGNNILNNFTATLSPFNYFSAHNAGLGIAGSSSSFGSGAAPGNPFSGAAATGMGPTPDNKTRLKTMAFTLGNISYSLNIANVKDQYIEVIGRPTLTTTVGKPAEFFSGDEIRIALQGNFGGNVTNTPTGFTITVTPLTLENDVVTLDCNLQGSLIGTPLENFAVTTQTSPKPFTILKSYAKTTISVPLGATALVAGILERVEDDVHEGFPLLKDLPGIQYLFSNETTVSRRKSIIYLLTPRSYGENLRETKAHFLSGLDFGPRPALDMLSKKYPNWFDPARNQIHILENLGPNYQSFRNGDVPPLRWGHATDLEVILTQIVDALWF